MKKINLKFENDFYYSQLTLEKFVWFQNDTGAISFDNKYYCVDENHYITQPNWVICEICNCIVKGKEIE
ncbi:MAG: hypothetical protein PSV16_03415 [Flavobacterium sp.]|nr:hypothetical protein [Flavobacterium sp.]